MMIQSRIQDAIKQKKLLEFKPPKKFRSVEKVKDYLIPYEKFFYKGAEFVQNDVRLQRPTMVSQPRRFDKILPQPRIIIPPQKMVSNSMFDSMQGINAYYKYMEYAVPRKKLNAKADTTGLYMFTEKMVELLDWPLCAEFESWDEDEELEAFHLLLPVMSYEQEEAGIFEAFLTGHENVAGMMIHLDGDRELDFTANERKLIKAVGYQDLCKFYQEFDDDSKTVNLAMLEDWYTCFFQHLEAKYPHINVEHIPIISGQGYEYVMITCLEDIQFAAEFTVSYEDLCSRMPDVHVMEHDPCEKATEEFVRDMLRIWKKGH